MYKITDKDGFKIFATFSLDQKEDAFAYAEKHGLVAVEIVFCNDHNSLYH